MRIKIYILYAILLYGLTFTIGCFLTTDNSDGEVYDFTESEQRTLESLQKVDDYPLYVMTYYGDYGRESYFFSENNISDDKQYYLENDERCACTCFTAMGNPESKIFGRNFDFFHRPGLILFTNPPNAHSSVSMVDIYYCGYDINTPITTLEDRRGLLSAPLLPFDGINEKGVAIGLMAVPYAEPPYSSTKKMIYDLDVIRLVLDYADDTDEAIDLINNYNIEFTEIPLHFLIADSSGHSAVIEFINDSLIVIENDLPYQVSTNFLIYNELPDLEGNCWRYDSALDALEDSNGNISLNDGMNILNSVSQNNTMWSIEYIMNTGDIMVVAGRNYDRVKEYNLEFGDN